MKFKIGDIVKSKSGGAVGIIIEDPDQKKNPGKLVVQIHPFIFGQIEDNDWELIQVS